MSARFGWLALIVLSGLLAAEPGNSSSGPRVTIQASANRSKLKRYTHDVIVRDAPALCALFRIQPARLDLVLLDDETEWQALLGAVLPPWTEAVTLFPQALIVIKSPVLTGATLRNYRTTLRHELVHLIQGYKLPLNMTPRWFNEGLAFYLAGQFDWRQRVTLGRVVATGQLMPLSMVDRVLSFGRETAGMAYIQSAAAVEFIDQAYGSEIFARVLETMREGRSFDDALARTLDLNPGDFEDLWRLYAQKQYRYLYLLDLPVMLWFILPFLVILAWLLKRYRNRRIESQWDETEKPTSVSE